jgi:hypothetical protein
MAIAQQYTGLNNLPGGGPMGGGNRFTTIYSADPDIAAQGAEARKTQQAGFDFKNQRFNQLLPMLQGAMGNGNFSSGGSGINVPAPEMGGPHIQGGPLYTQQAIQQNLNANRAQIDKSTATNNQNMANSMAGKGFGSGSPLLAALQNQSAMSGLGQKADYTREFTNTARQANANFGLQTANARQNQFAGNQQAMLGYGQNLLQNQANQIRSQGQNQQFQSSLLGTLSGLMN